METTSSRPGKGARRSYPPHGPIPSTKGRVAPLGTPTRRKTSLSLHGPTIEEDVSPQDPDNPSRIGCRQRVDAGPDQGAIVHPEVTTLLYDAHAIKQLYDLRVVRCCCSVLALHLIYGPASGRLWRLLWQIALAVRSGRPRKAAKILRHIGSIEFVDNVAWIASGKCFVCYSVSAST